MNRSFRTFHINGKFIISEMAVSHRASVSRKLAWQRARSQAAPVIFIGLDGVERDLGDCFDTETWERAMYSGHVSYQLSMTDGHYAPKGFDTWVNEFRKAPSATYNDAAPETIAAFVRYVALAA